MKRFRIAYHGIFLLSLAFIGIDSGLSLECLTTETRNNKWTEWSAIQGVIAVAITPLIIYKQQFLHSDWLRTCQLIPNQCKKV